MASFNYGILLFLILATIFSIIMLPSLLKNEETQPQPEETQTPEEEKILEPPKFSHASGFYPEDFQLKLTSEKNTKIFYTVDSSDPKTSNTSQEYKNEILIYDRSSEPNIYSAIGGDENSPICICRFQPYFHPPTYPVKKAMVIRAVTKDEKGEFSSVVSETFFVTNKDLIKYKNTTVISLVTDPENLFSPETGIYVTGNMFIEWKNSPDFIPGLIFGDERLRGNFYMKGSDWEREASLTIFDKGEINVQQNVGIRIKGSYTRIVPQKSFNIYAKKQYGKSTIETNILDDNFDINGNLITSYKRMSFRSIYDNSRIRDAIARDLFYSRKDLTTVNSHLSVLFLNGEYWGAYYIQEKLTDDFIETNYLIKSKNVALLKDNELEEGPEEELTKFKDFCKEYTEKDLANDEIYEEIKKFMDVDSFIELYASEIYISNDDWPGKNDAEWRNIGEKIEGNEYSDGKWRYIMIDVDYSMNDSAVKVDRFNHTQSRMDRAEVIKFFIYLIKNNSDFRNKFINVFCDYANEVCKPLKVSKIIEKYKEENYAEILKDSIVRWGRTKPNLLTSEEIQQIDTINDFFKNRSEYALEHMKKFLNLTGSVVDLTIKVKGKGKVQINSIIPELINDSWTGKYFTEIPITIKAIPDEGYEFKEWTGYDKSIQQNDEIILLGPKEITATFIEKK